jgi:hypothetical protein
MTRLAPGVVPAGWVVSPRLFQWAGHHRPPEGQACLFLRADTPSGLSPALEWPVPRPWRWWLGAAVRCHVLVPTDVGLRFLAEIAQQPEDPSEWEDPGWTP